MAPAPFPELHELADAAGVSRHWRDVDGRDRVVDDAVVAAVLAALGHAAGSARQVRSSLRALAERGRTPPRMIVTEVGLPTLLTARSAIADVTGEDGVTRRLAITGGLLAPIDTPGYYDLAFDGCTTRLAVAPPRCPLPGAGQARMWGTSLQIASLRGSGSRAFGGFGELADAARALARRGCDAIAINPVHALFPGDGEDFSPYSPSSRTFLNAAMGDPALLGLPPLPDRPGGALIDWPGALPRRLADLRGTFAMLDPVTRKRIAQSSATEGEPLLRHALFDALHCHFRNDGARDCRDWPAAFRDPGGKAVQRWAAENRDEVNFHLFAQWLARESLCAVQGAAREAGMAVGLIADLAVGVRPGGSDCWAMPDAMLNGLTIGAPPDPLGPQGQNWSITGFSPDGLHRAGYAPWIAMLRAALRSAGGLRIDHAYGLSRLWVIPDGSDSSRGAYLEYPFLDLIRLVTLEAHRARALIIAEDLGTAPPGFTHTVSERGMLGMRVLWFERAQDHGFIGAHDYPASSVAMTGTHDTQTVAGWWTGRDLDWAEKLGRLPPGVDRTKADAIRDWDRGLLWSTIDGRGPRPAPEDPDVVVEAALRHVARTPAALAVAPVEDILGDVEQPNLPGTVSGHPNWCHRMPAPLADLLDEPRTALRIAAMSRDG